jgi:hypothetical protein
MQNDMNIESLPVAIGYEMKVAVSAEYRLRNGSVQSDNYTVETANSDLDFDPEVPRESEGSDSPAMSLRKKL